MQSLDDWLGWLFARRSLGVAPERNRACLNRQPSRHGREFVQAVGTDGIFRSAPTRAGKSSDGDTESHALVDDCGFELVAVPASPPVAHKIDSVDAQVAEARPIHGAATDAHAQRPLIARRLAFEVPA